uniref:RNA-directed DNA polymerase, eukaryota n=1 Tax=Tanacetum cinerariifolium TaxID=118510 RepID=A0A699L750_TANCI|nr:RNA-directed DNA polymerase, eukaryota [Tanacetum cinerariifolium]
MFRKHNSTVSDYFVAIQGDWIPNAKKYLIISVYAPQEVSEKKLIWSYLDHVIHNWMGETIIMGDFNEVRSKEERHGSTFNAHNAAIFNSIIISSSLAQVPLGGCSFTWCHKSGNKMSKLDRFLISNGLLGSCPNISAIALDRFLLDHRPILLREVCLDYGPIPFQFYHYWFDWEDFDKFVLDSWNELSIHDSNAISKFMKKLKCLKEKIRLWTKMKKESSKLQKMKLKKELSNMDILIDNKCANQEIINKRSQVMHFLPDLEKLESMEVAQKVKIKWSIEGDDNSKYYHGLLNKSRNQLSIRGVLSDASCNFGIKAINEELPPLGNLPWLKK